MKTNRYSAVAPYGACSSPGAEWLWLTDRHLGLIELGLNTLVAGSSVAVLVLIATMFILETT
jgi:hypothetical protein